MLRPTDRTWSPIEDDFLPPGVLQQSYTTKVKTVLPKFGSGDQSLEVPLLLRYRVVNIQMDCVLLLEHMMGAGICDEKGVRKIQ